MATSESATTSSTPCVKKHHEREGNCYKRASYREGRWERAVKVYTINQESKYVMVLGVPTVGATKELLERFALYGEIEEYRHLDEYPVEEFTEAYWIKYKRIQSARFGKKKMDNRSFFGGLLHVFYAPEYENEDDTRTKLNERKRMVLRKCKEYFGSEKETHSVKDVPINTVIATVPKPSPQPSSTRPLPPPPPRQRPLSSTQTTLSRKQQFPNIPTKQATLPVGLQTLSTEEVYPEQETSLTLQQRKQKEQDDLKQKIEEEEKKKRIVWNTNAPVNPFTYAHKYTKQPGAWNPHPSAKREPKKEEITETDIRKRLLKTAEPKMAAVELPEISPLDMVVHTTGTPVNDPPPSKRKRANDGRKRI